MSELNKGLETTAEGALLPQWVRRQALARPNAPALVAGSEVVTYGELESRANQIARHLGLLGVGPEKLVGLCLDRSPQMVVWALGILKAGAAYLPLDPVTPTERLAFMLRDANVAALVSDHGLRSRLPVLSCPVIDLEKDSAAIENCSAQAVQIPLAAENLVYVIYTSGSTGQPKGVEITHGGLKNLIEWHLRAFQVTSADCASHQAVLGFDAAVWEVWPYLAAGASVHFPEDSLRPSPEALRDWMVSERITITFLSTAVAERMLLLDWPAKTALRILLTGADTLHRRPGANLPFKLVNNYGPTEATVVATSGIVLPAGTEIGPPSIGRPIDNTQAYILDEQREPVPAGQVGELYIGGAGLARGYRNRPDLTAEKFVTKRFDSGREQRLYRTGDRARFLANGDIEFLGRLDDQIKIRGYRIEPNEIVTALNTCSAIETSAVITRDEKGSSELVAYIVPRPEAKLSSGVLRDFLGERLPQYMIPTVFVKVDALPLTANGKLEREALPLPDESCILMDSTYVAPSGVVQERLSAIIAPLLHVERVGANDNFFLLGGHSLLGTQLITRIHEVFGVELSLLNLFDHPTLAEMSVEVERLVRERIYNMSAEEVLQALSQTGLVSSL